MAKKKPPAKNPHAVALGRKGGLARVANQTAEERAAHAGHASRMHWKRVREQAAKEEKSNKPNK